MRQIGFGSAQEQSSHLCLRVRARSIWTIVCAGTIWTVVIFMVVLPQTPALAQARPAWRISAQAFPSNIPPSGRGLIKLRVENVGDAPSQTGSPMIVVDQLSSGMIATRAASLFPQSFTLEPLVGGWGECAISSGGHLVTCTYQAGDTIAPSSITPVQGISEGAGQGALAPPIGIEVEAVAAGTLVDTATATGGGASKEASDEASFNVSTSSAPFGLVSSHQWSTNADGSPAVQAGSHPDETTTSFTFTTRSENGGELGRSGVVRDLDVELPPGFVGNPDAVEKCPRVDFDIRLERSGPLYGNPICPSNTQIGVARVFIAEADGFSVVLPVYNLVPPAGVPAQFGIGYQKFVGFLDAGVRPGTGGGYNLVADTDDIQSDGIFAVVVTLWGDPADVSHNTLRVPEGQNEPEGALASTEKIHRPFLSLPTSCGVPQELSVSTVSWEDPLAVPFSGAASTDEQDNTVEMEGCSKLDFSPSIQADADTAIAEKPAGLSVNIELPQNEDPNGLREADLKNVSVTLPEGMTVSPSAANGLEACSEEQLGVSGSGNSLLFNESPVDCPPASKVGSAEVVTPLLEHPLQGALYLAQQEVNPFNSLVALYLVAEGSGVLVKRAGEVHLNQQTGQITVTFQNNPQVPLSEIKVDTFQNEQSSVMTPSHCGAYAMATSMTAWNGDSAAPSSGPFPITEGCSQGFSPQFSAGSTNNQAGMFSPFSVTFSRQDGEQRIANASVLAPPGLSAILRGVQRCPEPQASNGTCGPESQIGHATVAVGPGSKPFYAPGNVFITGPYEGAPFGLSIVARAKAGPFDLGNVIVRARISVDPHTAQIVVTPDGSGPFAIPTILKGIPLDLRLANVTVDRPGFTFNPTNCSRLAVSGVITPTSGIDAAVSSPFQAAGCAKLPFKPTFTVSTQAETSKAYGASLTVKITKKPGEANLHKADLQLPIALPARLTTLQKACTEAQFNANPAGCPAGSVIGTAKVITPVLNVPVTGPAILVSHGGAAFPDLELVLQGEGVTVIVDGATDIKKGITYSKFETAPDQPFTSFETRLPEGPYSVLATDIPAKAKGDLCGQKLTMGTTLTGQNGAQLVQTTKIGVSGCPRAMTRGKKAVPSGRHPKLSRRVK
jgi:hypothetical protein